MKYFWQILGWVMTFAMAILLAYLAWFQPSLPAVPANINTGTTLGVVTITPILAIAIFCLFFIYIQTKMADNRPEKRGWLWVDVVLAFALTGFALSIVFAWAGLDLYTLVKIPTPAHNALAMEAVWLCGASALLDLFGNLYGRGQKGGQVPFHSEVVHPAAASLGNGSQAQATPIIRQHVAHVEPFLTVGSLQTIHGVSGSGDEGFIVRGTARFVATPEDDNRSGGEQPQDNH